MLLMCCCFCLKTFSACFCSASLKSQHMKTIGDVHVCRASLIAAIVQVKSCVCILCLYMCVCMNVSNSPAAISPHVRCDGSATRCHTPQSCRCKKQSTHVSRSHREQRDSAGLMRDDKGIIMKHSCCFATDLDWYSTKRDADELNPPTQLVLRWNKLPLIPFVNCKDALRF